MPVDDTTVAAQDHRAFEAALDALEAPTLPPRPGPGAVFLRSVLPPIVAVVTFIALWQLAYSEIYVTDTLWPDFRRTHMLEAIVNYQRRDRRFGGLQLVANAK